ncbi:RecB-like exonuclease [Mycobacterium phage DmpstrDiver]|nr:RecB-like exonuclease [Mycobacterium phage DmpstrDiver]
MEAEGETHSEAMELALSHIKALWDRTANKPLDINRDQPAQSTHDTRRLVKCWASGTEVYFDPIEHAYTDAQGNKYLGGSTFAHRYTTEFPSEIISGKMAEKYGVSQEEILAMWELNSEASTTVGSALHAALQLREQYANLSRAIKGGSLEACTTGNPILRPIVEAFFEGREHEVAVPEAFVADPKRHHCGFIDRLLIEDDGVWVEDYKTSKDVQKSETILEPFKDLVPNTQLGTYWLQLSFYSRILNVHGKNVKGLRVHHWTGKAWETHEHPVIDLDAAFKEN